MAKPRKFVVFYMSDWTGSPLCESVETLTGERALKRAKAEELAARAVASPLSSDRIKDYAFVYEGDLNKGTKDLVFVERF